MSDLVVIAFTRETDGLAALKHIREMEGQSGLSLVDSAVVEKDPDGKIHVRNEVSSTTEMGAVGGGLLGLMLGLVFFPILGIALGALAGAAVGKSLGHGVDQGFVKEIQDQLAPGTSALFAVVRSEPSALVTAVRGFEGKVYQTSLDPELEEALNSALKTGG